MSYVLAVRNSVGVTIDSKFSFAAWFPPYLASFWLILYTNPLLLRRHWADWRKQLCEESIQWCHHYRWSEMDFTPFPLLFSSSTFQGAASTEYRMSTSGKVEHHPFSSFLTFSIRFVDMSSVPFLLGVQALDTNHCPRVNVRAYSITLRTFAIQILFVSSSSPINVIVHWHEDDPSFELLWFTLWHSMNLVEKSQCSESWVFFPLELNRLPVDSIQIFEMTCFPNHLTLLSHALTGSVLIPTKHSTESEKDAGFASCKLISSFS